MNKIDGVTIRNLIKIPDERGAILPMLRRDDKEFTRFGEIYFSKIYPGVIKAWHLHKKMTLRYTVIIGMIKLVLFDPRKNSPTYGNLLELFIGEENYSLITIPPNIWNGFKCISGAPAIVANCADFPHEDKEMIRLDPLNNSVIEYNWDIIYR